MGFVGCVECAFDRGVGTALYFGLAILIVGSGFCCHEQKP